MCQQGIQTDKIVVGEQVCHKCSDDKPNFNIVQRSFEEKGSTSLRFLPIPNLQGVGIGLSSQMTRTKEESTDADTDSESFNVSLAAYTMQGVYSLSNKVLKIRDHI